MPSTTDPEHIGAVLARLLAGYCACDEREPPINPERACGACGAFIEFDSTHDCLDWIESMKIPASERKLRP